MVLALASSAALLSHEGTISSATGHGGVTTSTVFGRRRLIQAQLCCATGLLILAGLFIRTTLRELAFDPGVDMRNAAVAWLSSEDPELVTEVASLSERLPAGEQRLIAGIGTTLPGTGNTNSHLLYWPPGRAFRYATARYVSPRYFDAVGVRFTRGRAFREGERQGVAIVSAAVASELRQDGAVVGTQLEVGEPTPPRRLLTIVGVAADARTWDGRTDRAIYLPLREALEEDKLALIVRGPAALGHARALVDRALRERSLRVGVVSVTSIQQDLDHGAVGLQMMAQVLGGLGGSVFVIVTVALYGVLAHLAILQRRDISIRRALGATNASIYARVARDIGRALAGGIASGAVFALLAGLALRHYVWSLRELDAPTYIVVPAALLVLTMAASLLPFRQLLREPLSGRTLTGE
jgi:hypothetical protein